MIYLMPWYLIGIGIVLLILNLQDGYTQYGHLVVAVLFGFVWPLILVFVLLSEIDYGAAWTKRPLFHRDNRGNHENHQG